MTTRTCRSSGSVYLDRMRNAPGRWLVICLAVLASLGDGPANAASARLFGTTETRSNNFKPFKKWTAAVERTLREAAGRPGSCQETSLNACHYKAWMEYLDELRGLDPMEQVRKVNHYMNRQRYITDPKNWGKKDYWASPGEFLNRRGDCEDYAIAKYVSLKRLGFTDEQVRLIAVKDLNLKVGHAILGVWMNDTIYILDNQVKPVTEHTRIRHYQPVFSINETAWWRHRG